MSNVNPLLLPEILGNVLKFLGLNDLLNSRKVCKLWWIEASPFIGKSCIICIHDSNRLQKLHDLINSNEHQPFRHFELWSFHLDLDNEDIERQIRTVGPYFHQLTVNFDKDSDNLISIRAFRDLLFFHFPNLTSLVIRQLPSKILKRKQLISEDVENKLKQPLLPFLKKLTLFSDGDYNSEFLKSILSSSPNLLELKVAYGDEPKNFKTELLTSLFSCSKKLRYLESLQYFMHDPGSGSCWAFSPEQCIKLAECNFRLKSLKLHPKGPAQTRTMYQLLTSVADTLQHLKLRFHDQLNCPRIDTLISVTLYDYEGSFKFLDNLPNLRHLGLCEYIPAKFLTPENIVSKQHASLASLNFYGSYAVSNHLFHAIARSFPNLRVLNFWNVNNEKLKIVIESFPLLEELSINVTDVDDAAFTGLQLEICEELERQSNYDEVMQVSATYFGRTSFIGQLQRLRRLELHGACLADWKWSSVSDVSIYFSLIHLKSLTSLCLYDFKWITERAILKLCESIPLIYLKIDTRAFSGTLPHDIHSIRPDIRLEAVHP